MNNVFAVCVCARVFIGVCGSVEKKIGIGLVMYISAVEYFGKW